MPERSSVNDDPFTIQESFCQPLLALLDHSSLACIAVSADGKISAWSSGATSTFGWTQKEALRCSLAKIKLDHLQLSSDDECEVSSCETQGVDKSGTHIILQVKSTPLESGGHLLLISNVTELRFLERAMLEAAEREQRRIGQELHDNLCQHLVGAAFAAKALAGSLDRDHSPHSESLHDLARLINDSVSQAREISRGLYPVEMDSAGLMSALQELANRARHSVECTFRCEATVLVENRQGALNAFRIAQEAISNALQQTGAKKIVITLKCRAKSVSLEVCDDGAMEGELTANPQSTVAKTLQYRAAAMKGLVKTHYKKGRGTTTTCTFPQFS